jgi:cellulose synthase/poly-beta-1,6-N-acetylglucosamine synthase-like glycosyltransferase
MVHYVSYAVLLVSLAAVAYTWLSYPLILFLPRVRHSHPWPVQEPPHLTVLITVRNGAQKITARLKDVLAQDYPPDRLKIFVASDGSDDDTTDKARLVPDSRITVRSFAHGGKSVTQNAAIKEISDEIIVMTDVDTTFAPGFLAAITRPFADSGVGCVSGHLYFTKCNETTSVSQSLYWRFEIWLRRRESDVGLLATATGACMAFRRKLFRPLMPACGEDCTIPLDTVDQGFLVVHADDAVAYDYLPDTARGELRARARMTSRNLRGTLAYPHLLTPWRHPGFALSLWSHKLLRWATPVFLGAVVVSSVILYPEARPIIYAELLFLLFATSGLLLHMAGLPQPRVFSTPFSFSLANCGFLLGLFQFLLGREPVSYSNKERVQS